MFVFALAFLLHSYFFGLNCRKKSQIGGRLNSLRPHKSQKIIKTDRSEAENPFIPIPENWKEKAFTNVGSDSVNFPCPTLSNFDAAKKIISHQILSPKKESCPLLDLRPLVFFPSLSGPTFLDIFPFCFHHYALLNFLAREPPMSSFPSSLSDHPRRQRKAGEGGAWNNFTVFFYR